MSSADASAPPAGPPPEPAPFTITKVYEHETTVWTGPPADSNEGVITITDRRQEPASVAVVKTGKNLQLYRVTIR